MEPKLLQLLSELSIERAVEEAPHLLPIHDLRGVLAQINDASKRYWLDGPVVVWRLPESTIGWIMLYCACPIEGQMTDELSFALPVLSDTVVPGGEERALVCLAPDTLYPVQEGLYLEDGRVLGDCMEDWFLVWPTLHQALLHYESARLARLEG